MPGGGSVAGGQAVSKADDGFLRVNDGDEEDKKEDFREPTSQKRDVGHPQEQRR